jgi:hypothetical protein
MPTIATSDKGLLVRIIRFNHPHIKSLLKEGLWGFPDGKNNRAKWKLIEIGSPVLFYGDYKGKPGVWLRGVVIDKFENKEPVKYWIQNPTGYPLQIRVEVWPKLKNAEPITKEELVTIFDLKKVNIRYGWSLEVYDKEKKIEIFKKAFDEFEARNLIKVDIAKPTEPSHSKIKEIIYQTGVVEGKFPIKEYKMDDGRKLDVIWRKTTASVPNWAFEVQLGGNVTEALSKVKHAWDIYNSIPIIVTTESQLDVVNKLLEGSFHEIKEIIRVTTLEEIKKFYDIKIKLRNMKNKLRII